MNQNCLYKYKCKVEFEDCDMQNIVHHPKLLCYLERARLDCLRQEFYTYNDMIKDNTCFVITDVKLKFINPCFYNDDLIIITQVSGAYAHSLKVNQIITKKDSDLPLNDLISDKNSCLFSSMRLSMVNIQNREPIKNSEEIFKKINIKKDSFSIKDVIFKHPFK